MKFFENLQNLPFQKRKIILLVIVSVVAVLLFLGWFLNLRKTLKNFSTENFFKNIQLPSFPKEELEKMKFPKNENFLNLNEEQLKELEKSLEEAAQEKNENK
jgi:uncharacterized membrane protein YvbJ